MLAAGRPRRRHVAQAWPRAFRLSLEAAPTGAPALSTKASHAGSLPPAAFRNAPEAGPGESMPKRGKTGLGSTVSAPFLRPLFRIGKLRLPARAVTGSSMQDARLLGRWWKTPNVTQRPHCAGS